MSLLQLTLPLLCDLHLRANFTYKYKKKKKEKKRPLEIYHTFMQSHSLMKCLCKGLLNLEPLGMSNSMPVLCDHKTTDICIIAPKIAKCCIPISFTLCIAKPVEVLHSNMMVDFSRVPMSCRNIVRWLHTKSIFKRNAPIRLHTTLGCLSMLFK